MPQELITIRTSYRPLRGLVSSVDTNLTDAQKKWSYFVANLHPNLASGIAMEMPRHQQVTIIFDLTTEGDTGTFFIYGVREAQTDHQVAPIERICTSALVAGAQETNDETPRFFADTISAPTDSWPATVSSDATSGLNNVAHLTFDYRGYRYLLCLFTVISAGGIRAWIAYH